MVQGHLSPRLNAWSLELQACQFNPSHHSSISNCKRGACVQPRPRVMVPQEFQTISHPVETQAQRRDSKAKIASF